ncbi:hypothetical protein [Novosphingobium sp. 9]|uniref:hypothetical protein n=1 Tax=Novosphingobium sp. 9 TaxID=2025349 RepID=UPI0021B5DE38|nr:hypothetical protein [Novosphingobium sp. 9]
MGNFVNGLFGALVAMATLSSPLEAVAQDQAASPAQVPGEVSPTQTVSHNPDGETSSAISDKDSILVQTERNSNKALDALPTQTQAPHLPGTVNTTSRQIRAMSLFFVRCAEVPKSPAMFRSIVDNGPLDLEAQRALHEYIVRHQGCYQGVPDFSFPSPTLASAMPILMASAAPLTIVANCTKRLSKSMLHITDWGRRRRLIRR